MFDIGWTEILVIAIVLIVVVGPKDLPPMLRAFGKMTANLRKMAGEFRTQFDEALRESELDDVRKTIADAQSLNPTNALREAINPLRQMGQDIKADLQKATQVPSPVMTPADPAMTATDVAAQKAVEGTPPGQPSPEVPMPAAPLAAVPVPPVTVSELPAVKPRAVRKTAAKAKPAAEPAPAAAAPEVSAAEVGVPEVAAKPKRVRAAAKPAAVAEVVSAPDVSAAAPANAPARKRAPKKTEMPKDDA